MADVKRENRAEDCPPKRLKYKIEEYDDELLDKIDTLLQQVKAIDAINREICRDFVFKSLRPTKLTKDYNRVYIDWDRPKIAELNLRLKIDSATEFFDYWVQKALAQQPKSCYETLLIIKTALERKQVKLGKWHSNHLFLSTFMGTPFGVVSRRMSYSEDDIDKIPFNTLDLSQLSAAKSVDILCCMLRNSPKPFHTMEKPVMNWDLFESQNLFFIWKRKRKYKLYSLLSSQAIRQISGKKAGTVWISPVLTEIPDENCRIMNGKWLPWIEDGQFKCSSWKSTLCAVACIINMD